ncbi:helix-turn-helix domain-containing protein [Nocardia transvalensis]|uniref:helix-turn-helix domain-containing protein n=1 Tax=Nocardia transvalensis TaxID=37333 RepID=UPI0018938AC6|nr:helix-turn-helix domain-containing protein [Nocardia transvalensis]MBF6332464.1 helix-turn-helix domain-containing protein [Nocardia transvalensis]
MTAPAAEYNVVAELGLPEHDHADLVAEFADFHPVVGRSLLGRTELIFTVHAASVWAATQVGHALLARRHADAIVSLQVLATADFDRLVELEVLPPLMSVTEAADQLGVTRTRVQQLLDSGALAGRKAGATWVILASSVRAARDTDDDGSDG